MRGEVMVVVRIPLQEVAEEVRTRNSLTEALFDAKLEGDNLVLYFRRTAPDRVPAKVAPEKREQFASAKAMSTTGTPARPMAIEAVTVVPRRRTGKRNRMKTRGWQVIAKIQNSKGQTAMVYKPFVDALFSKELTPAQKRSVVAGILRSNGNEPTEASVDYFLMNTLEYLAQVNKEATTA